MQTHTYLQETLLKPCELKMLATEICKYWSKAHSIKKGISAGEPISIWITFYCSMPCHKRNWREDIKRPRSGISASKCSG